jgi:hypothetical protein
LVQEGGKYESIFGTKRRKIEEFVWYKKAENRRVYLVQEGGK